MANDERNVVSNNKGKEKSPSNLQPLQNLKGLDADDSSGFICDIETGVCGPVNQKKEGNNA